MRTWVVACAAVLILGVVSSGCRPTSEASASEAKQDTVSDGIHEYRAVCTQKNLHDGNEIVLSKWLEIRKTAKDLGDYHADFKNKGHVVRIEKRVKPKPGVPQK